MRRSPTNGTIPSPTTPRRPPDECRHSTALATFPRTSTLAPAGTGRVAPIDAALAAGYGMTDDRVLRAVTLVPAQILGVADASVRSRWVDADVIVLDGPPLSVNRGCSAST
jgi:hypothetical protein